MLEILNDQLYLQTYVLSRIKQICLKSRRFNWFYLFFTDVQNTFNFFFCGPHIWLLSCQDLSNTRAIRGDHTIITLNISLSIIPLPNAGPEPNYVFIYSIQFLFIFNSVFIKETVFGASSGLDMGVELRNCNNELVRTDS